MNDSARLRGPLVLPASAQVGGSVPGSRKLGPSRGNDLRLEALDTETGGRQLRFDLQSALTLFANVNAIP